MSQLVLSEPIKIGFPYSLLLLWPATFLPGADTIEAELRRTPEDALLADFAVVKTDLGDGNIQTELSLTAVQTAALPVTNAQTEPVLVTGASRLAINLLIKLQIREHTTKAA